MKKILLFSVLITLLSVQSAQAQIEIGLKAGVNFASLTGDFGDIYDGRTGFLAGAYLAYALSKSIALQAELVYSLQGGENAFDEELNYDYLYLPILIRLHLIAGLSALAGVQIGFLMAAEFIQSGSEFDIKDDTNSTDFGLVIGAMYSIWRLNVFLRYVVGLSEIGTDAPSLVQTGDTKNGVFQAGVDLRLIGKAKKD